MWNLWLYTLDLVVARGGIEPPTRGFSVRRRGRLGARKPKTGKGFLLGRPNRPARPNPYRTEAGRAACVRRYIHSGQQLTRIATERLPNRSVAAARHSPRAAGDSRAGPWGRQCRTPSAHQPRLTVLAPHVPREHPFQHRSAATSHAGNLESWRTSAAALQVLSLLRFQFQPGGVRRRTPEAEAASIAADESGGNRLLSIATLAKTSHSDASAKDPNCRTGRTTANNRAGVHRSHLPLATGTHPSRSTTAATRAGRVQIWRPGT